MGDFIEAALGFPAVLFSFLLLVVIGYWMVVLFGGLGVDVHAHGHGTGPDGASADGTDSAGTDGADAGTGLSELLTAAGLGGVPVTVVASLLIAVAWFASLAGTVLLPGGAFAVVVLLVALAVAWLTTRLLVSPLRRNNRAYIASAAQSDASRTEPPFRLQGSYRNMNKLAERIVPVMNDDELEAAIDAHYLAEAQTLTTGAEANLLKLAELRGRMTAEQAGRWAEVKAGYLRARALGGAPDDPMSRAVGAVGLLADRVGAVEVAIERASDRLANGRRPAAGGYVTGGDYLEGSILGEAVLPVFDPLTEPGHMFRADAVFGEVLIVEAVDAAQHAGEELPIEAGVGVVGEFAKLVEGVTAAGERGVDVEEVAGGGAVVQRVHLAGHDVVGMQDRADVHLYRRLGAPVGDQFDPVLPVRLVRVGDVQPGECVQPKVDLDIQALGPVRGDHVVHRGREVRPALPVGEQVHPRLDAQECRAPRSHAHPRARTRTVHRPAARSRPTGGGSAVCCRPLRRRPVADGELGEPGLPQTAYLRRQDELRPQADKGGPVQPPCQVFRAGRLA